MFYKINRWFVTLLRHCCPLFLVHSSLLPLPPPPPSTSFSAPSVSFLAPPPRLLDRIANFSHITLSIYSVDLSQTLFIFAAFEKMTFVHTNSARQGLIVCNQYTLYKEADTRDCIGNPILCVFKSCLIPQNLEAC